MFAEARRRTGEWRKQHGGVEPEENVVTSLVEECAAEVRTIVMEAETKRRVAEEVD